LGGKSDHRNCANNLVEALTSLGTVHSMSLQGLRTLDLREKKGIKPPQFTPSLINLFVNIPVHSDLRTLSFEPSASKAGDYVCLRAEVDLVVAFSACPQVILYFIPLVGGEE
jgi:uncharacterized protein YcgI (DUF1989 family)